MKDKTQDFLIVLLALGLVYTGYSVYELKTNQSELADDIDHLQDQNYLAEIHRSYNASKETEITVDTEDPLSKNQESLSFKISVNTHSGMFRLSEVRVTAYDSLKNELWSTTRDADFRGEMLKTNDSYSVSIDHLAEVQEGQVEYIEVEAVDETTYIKDSGEFDYGISYDGRDVGAQNPKQKFLVEKNCLSGDFSDHCVNSFEPIKSYEVVNKPPEITIQSPQTWYNTTVPLDKDNNSGENE